jgi:hypothetical protein
LKRMEQRMMIGEIGKEGRSKGGRWKKYGIF